MADYTPEQIAAAGIQLAPGQAPDGSVTRPSEVTPERPAGLPEKFATVDDLIKAYGELEKKQGQAKPAEEPADEGTEEKPPESTQEAPAETDEGKVEEAADKAVEAAGLNRAELQAEFERDGKLSEASYAKLAAIGIDSEMVDDYIAGRQAVADAATAKVYEYVGGKETLDAMFDWAKDNLKDAEKDAVNAALTSRDFAKIELALDGLKSRYEAAEGSTPKLLDGDPKAPTGEAFLTQQDMVDAMKDPRYKTSEAYRQEVRAKAARSSF